MSDPIIKLTETEADEATRAVRELMRFETELLNQRVSWLLQIQGLLFAALAFAWNDTSLALLGLLSALGIATAASIAIVLYRFSPAMRSLYAWWSERLTVEQQNVRLVIGYWSPSRGIAWLLRPWRALPIVFVVTWLSVMAIALARYCAAHASEIGLP